jgi:hypothetical protein
LRPCRPEAGAGVAHALFSVSRSIAMVRVITRALRAHVCQCVQRCNLTRIALQSLCAFIDDHMPRFGHHIGHRAAVLGLVQALRYASTRSAGPWALTTPALRSKVALM